LIEVTLNSGNVGCLNKNRIKYAVMHALSIRV